MRPRAWHHLDELFAGACDGMTYEEIEELYPEEFQLRESDKLAYRYPRGESYLDVIARLEPIIMEMERHREPLLIVGHQGTVHCRSERDFYISNTSYSSSTSTPYTRFGSTCAAQTTHIYIRSLHTGILRIIYAFYMGLTRAEAPYVSVPLNCVLQLVPSAFSCEEKVCVLLNLTLDFPVIYIVQHSMQCDVRDYVCTPHRRLFGGFVVICTLHGYGVEATHS